MQYTFNSNGCLGVPFGSKVQLIDNHDDRFAFIYEGKWYGYYNFSLFKPYFNAKR